jgi:type II restriction enzyme
VDVSRASIQAHKSPRRLFGAGFYWGQNFMHPENKNSLRRLRSKYYFSALERRFAAIGKSQGILAAADRITEIMRGAQPEVEELILRRRQAGEIRDADQARKSLAGHCFQSLAVYALFMMQKEEMIPPRLICTLNTRHPLIESSAAIQVGGEKLKPDLDLLVYSGQAAADEPVCIYSLKTSLRERAGQTHRWRLLFDIVTSDNCRSIKEKYRLGYKGTKQFKMGMITTNFYDEISQPQQRGLLAFFDYVYLTKPGRFAPPVANFSRIAEDLRKTYDG